MATATIWNVKKKVVGDILGYLINKGNVNGSAPYIKCTDSGYETFAISANALNCKANIENSETDVIAGNLYNAASPKLCIYGTDDQSINIANSSNKKYFIKLNTSGLFSLTTTSDYYVVFEIDENKNIRVVTKSNKNINNFIIINFINILLILQHFLYTI